MLLFINLKKSRHYWFTVYGGFYGEKMFLFSFLVLPVLLVWFCFYKKNSKLLPSILFGMICAVVLSLFLVLFTFSHRIIPYDFRENLTYLLLNQTVLPLLIPYFLFVVFSRDNWEYKIENFLPLELSFFAVYLPFIILTTAEGLYSGFSLFIKPILFLVMILVCAFSVKQIYKSIISKKVIPIILFTVVFVIFMIIPSIVEALIIVYPF